MKTALIIVILIALGFASAFGFVLNYARKLERELSWTRKQWNNEVKKNDKC